MRLAIFTVSLLAHALAGCASTQTHVSSPPMDDPSWTPPGQLNFAIQESATRSEAAPRPCHAEAAAQPNKREVGNAKIRAAASMHASR